MKRWFRQGIPLRRLQMYAFGAGVAVCSQAMPVKVGVVCGHSMEPTLKNRSLYVMRPVRSVQEPVRRGEVVVFRHNGETYVKRVLAVGGDSVYVLREHGYPLDELIMDFQLDGIRRLSRNPIHGRHMKVVLRRVPQGMLYLVGDNPTYSQDSRDFGFVPRDGVIGRVVDAPAPPPLQDRVAGQFRSNAAS